MDKKFIRGEFPESIKDIFDDLSSTLNHNKILSYDFYIVDKNTIIFEFKDNSKMEIDLNNPYNLYVEGDYSNNLETKIDAIKSLPKFQIEKRPFPKQIDVYPMPKKIPKVKCYGINSPNLFVDKIVLRNPNNVKSFRDAIDQVKSEFKTLKSDSIEIYFGKKNIELLVMMVAAKELNMNFKLYYEGKDKEELISKITFDDPKTWSNKFYFNDYDSIGDKFYVKNELENIANAADYVNRNFSIYYWNDHDEYIPYVGNAYDWKNPDEKNFNDRDDWEI